MKSIRMSAIIYKHEEIKIWFENFYLIFFIFVSQIIKIHFW